METLPILVLPARMPPPEAKEATWAVHATGHDALAGSLLQVTGRIIYDFITESPKTDSVSDKHRHQRSLSKQTIYYERT